MYTPNPVPATNIANGTAGATDATGTVFTFGALSGGSIATLTSGTNPYPPPGYYLQCFSSAGVTPGLYQILSVQSAAASAAVKTPGMGYKTGDVLTVQGGVNSTASTWTVTQSGGGVTSLAQSVAGSYNVLPTNPVTFSGGAGTGCTATITWSAPTLGLATSPGTSAANVVWVLLQAYQIVPPGFASILVDNNGYQLDQQGGLTMFCGQVTTSSSGVGFCLTSSSTIKSIPCKYVQISPAAHNCTLGTSGLQSLSYLATAPLFVTLQVSDVSQVWVAAGASGAGDVVGWAAFN
jgi:hypothetical protein